MPLRDVFVPYGAYWSTPFCRWQGGLARLNSFELAAASARRFLATRSLPASAFDSLVLGSTVPQRRSFYGAPWVAGLLGAPAIGGTVIAQACATSVRALQSAALEIETGVRGASLVLTCDRTSNGPHLFYPDPGAPGGTGEAENWVLDNFSLDPWGGTSMLETAENVARLAKISRAEQDELTLLRYQQYDAALASDRAFQKRWMLPVEIGAGKKTTLIAADEGVFPTTAEGLLRLKPVLEGGTVTYGSQTHPADGNAGMLVCSAARLPALAPADAPRVAVLGFGDARVEKSHMPMAVVPAARAALRMAGIELSALRSVKTHNPFAVNDLYFCRETGWSPENMNRFGSSLVWGHPQAPTGLRSIVELIEELVQSGGGLGLFTGCAAGDTAMAVVLRVG